MLFAFFEIVDLLGAIYWCWSLDTRNRNGWFYKILSLFYNKIYSEYQCFGEANAYSFIIVIHLVKLVYSKLATNLLTHILVPSHYNQFQSYNYCTFIIIICVI